MLNAQHHRDLLQYRLLKGNEALTLRLQAYERLVLYCERISLDKMLVRLDDHKMDKAALKNVIILTIQMEFEHNLTQQLYVSSHLWEMIVLLKNQTIELVQQAYIDVGPGDREAFIRQVLRASDQLSSSMLLKVQQAIRKETSLQLDS